MFIARNSYEVANSGIFLARWLRKTAKRPTSLIFVLTIYKQH